MGLEAPNYSDNLLKILGYCEGSKEEILNLIQRGELESIQKMKGEFTIIHRKNKEVCIITSLIGGMQYFYFYDGIRFSHGEHIVDIILELDLAWEWDWESIGDLCEQENLTNNRTIHKRIRRVPAGAILEYKSILRMQTINLINTMLMGREDPIGAIDILNAETLRSAGNNPVLSLSGGFDSRLILSSMLKQGIYPKVLTLGNEDNSDMEVARMIIKRFSLQHITVNLSIEDLLDNGEHIAKITNGSKPACHWHTYLYPKKAGMNKNHTFFVGTLGEFARSYYVDKGLLSLLNEGFPESAKKRFWELKLLRHRTFFDHERRYMCESLSEQISPNGIKKRALRNANLSGGEFLSGFTRYYLEQRVPHFYANGISMYNDSTLWRSPFHNIDWLRKIWCLSDNWKLGSNWHRLAIKRNYPELLGFPEEKGFSRKRMLRRAPILYWLPMMQRNKYKNYDMSKDWYQDRKVRELILDNSVHLDSIVDKRLCETILDEHIQSKNRTRAISFILTMLYNQLSLSKRSS